MQHFRHSFCAGLGLLAACIAARADDGIHVGDRVNADQYLYLGAAGLKTRFAGVSHDQCANLALLTGSPNTGDCAVNAGDSGYKVFAGFSVQPGLELECGLVDPGHASAQLAPGGAHDSYRPLLAYGDIVGLLPDLIFDQRHDQAGKIRLLLRGGLYGAHTIVHLGNGNETGRNNIGLHGGVGLDYVLGQEVSLQLQYEQFRAVGTRLTGRATLGMTSLGLVLRIE